MNSPLNEIFKSLTSLKEELTSQNKENLKQKNLEKVKQFLLEKQLLNEISVKDAYAKFYKDIPENEFNEIVAADPFNKSNFLSPYSKWLLKRYQEGHIKLEDLDAFTEYFQVHNRYKDKYKNVDWNKLFTKDDLYNVVKDDIAYSQAKIGNVNLCEPIDGSIKFYEDSNWCIIIPKTEYAACYYGRNTEWCTAWGKMSFDERHKGKTNMFKSYSETPLYIVINKNNQDEKYQFHFETGQFMNVNDKQMSQDNPIFKEILPIFLQNKDFIMNLTLNGLINLLYYSKEHEKVLNLLGNKGKEFKESFINLTSDEIRDLLKKSKNPDKIIDLLLNIGGKEFIMKLNEYDIQFLLEKSTERDKIIDLLLNIGGKEFIIKLNLGKIETLLIFSSEPEKVIDIINQYGDDFIYLKKDFIMNLSSDRIKELLIFSSEPEKIIKLLGNKGKEFIMNLNSYGIDFLLRNSPNKRHRILDILLNIGGKEFIMNLTNFSPMFKSFGWQRDREIVIDKLLNIGGEEFIMNLSSDKIQELLRYSQGSEREKNKQIFQQYGKLPKDDSTTPINEIFNSLTSLQEELIEQNKINTKEKNLKKVKQFLLEKQMLNEISIQDAYGKFYKDIPQEEFDEIVKADPFSKPNFLSPYAKWLLKIYKNNNLKLEDLQAATEYLQTYHRYKDNYKNLDWNKLNTLADLYNVVKDDIAYSQAKTGNVNLCEPIDGSQKYYEDNNWCIIIPKTEYTACYYGRNTEWCTTWGEMSFDERHKGKTNRFEGYNNQGPLYIIINKNNQNEKYQFHFSSGQFMDINDSQMSRNSETLNELLNIFLSNDKFIENLTSKEFYNLLNITKDINKLFNTLIKMYGKDLMAKLKSNGINILFSRSKDRYELFNTLIKMYGKDFINEWDFDGLNQLLENSKITDSVFQTLLSIGKLDFILKLSSLNIYNLIKHSEFGDNMIFTILNILVKAGKKVFRNKITDSSYDRALIRVLLVYSSEPDKIINILDKYGKNCGTNFIQSLINASTYHIYMFLSESKAFDKLFDIAINIDASFLKLNQPNGSFYVKKIIALSKEPEKIRELVKKYNSGLSISLNENVKKKNLEKVKQFLLERQLLDEKDNRQFIVNKLGLPQEVADYAHNLSDKYSIWIANVFKERSELLGVSFDSFKRVHNHMLENIINMFKDDNRPNIDIKNLNFNDAEALYHLYGYIKDWRDNPDTPSINLRNMSWEEAENLSREWHESLGAGGRVSDILDDKDTIIHKFSNGFYWVFRESNTCEKSRASMGHCATASRDDMYLFRLIKNDEEYITADWHPKDRYIMQLKGKANTKPKKDYYPYILWLVADSGFIDELRTHEGYMSETNFHLEDLDEKQIDYVIKKNFKLFANFIAKLGESSNKNDQKLFYSMLIQNGDKLLSNISNERFTKLIANSPNPFKITEILIKLNKKVFIEKINYNNLYNIIYDIIRDWDSQFSSYKFRKRNAMNASVAITIIKNYFELLFSKGGKDFLVKIFNEGNLGDLINIIDNKYIQKDKKNTIIKFSENILKFGGKEIANALVQEYEKKQLNKILFKLGENSGTFILKLFDYVDLNNLKINALQNIFLTLTVVFGEGNFPFKISFKILEKILQKGGKEYFYNSGINNLMDFFYDAYFGRSYLTKENKTDLYNLFKKYDIFQEDKYTLKYYLTESALLTEKDNRKIIVDKLGLSQEIADWAHGLSDKYSLWIANQIKPLLESNPELKSAIHFYILEQQRNGFTQGFNPFAQYGLNILHAIEMFKDDNKPPLDIKNLNLGDTVRYYDIYRYITDWRDNPNTPTLNLRNMSWDEAERLSREWHESLQAGGKVSYILDEKDEIIHEFNDGFYWVLRKDSYCEKSRASMGHCATASSSDMYLFRLIKNDEEFITVDWHPYWKYVIQIKGKKNSKPKAEYYPYILWLIADSGFINELRTDEGYASENNFHLNDLNSEQLKYALNKNLNLIKTGNLNLENSNLSEKDLDDIINMILSTNIFKTEREIDFSDIIYSIKKSSNKDFFINKLLANKDFIEHQIFAYKNLESLINITYENIDNIVNFLIKNEKFIIGLATHNKLYVIFENKKLKNPDRIINILIKNKNFIENISIRDFKGSYNDVYILIFYSKNRKNVINTLLSNKDFMKNITFHKVETMANPEFMGDEEAFKFYEFFLFNKDMAVKTFKLDSDSPDTFNLFRLIRLILKKDENYYEKIVNYLISSNIIDKFSFQDILHLLTITNNKNQLLLINNDTYISKVKNSFISINTTNDKKSFNSTLHDIFRGNYLDDYNQRKLIEKLYDIPEFLEHMMNENGRNYLEKQMENEILSKDELNDIINNLDYDKFEKYPANVYFLLVNSYNPKYIAEKKISNNEMNEFFKYAYKNHKIRFYSEAINKKEIAEIIKKYTGEDVESSLNESVKKRNLEKVKQFLLEKQMLNEISINAAYENHYQKKGIPREEFDEIVAADPFNKPNFLSHYSKWMLKRYEEGHIKLEDLPAFTEYFKVYDRYKSRYNVDWNKLFTKDDLYNVVKDDIAYSQAKTGNVNLCQPIDGSQKYYEDSKWCIIIPKTEYTACYYGRNTEWCTAWGKMSFDERHKGKTNRFDYHHGKGPLYIIINKNNQNEKYQFHFPTGQFMDVNDKQLSTDSELYKELSSIFLSDDKFVENLNLATLKNSRILYSVPNPQKYVNIFASKEEFWSFYEAVKFLLMSSNNREETINVLLSNKKFIDDLFAFDSGLEYDDRILYMLIFSPNPKQVIKILDEKGYDKGTNFLNTLGRNSYKDLDSILGRAANKEELIDLFLSNKIFISNIKSEDIKYMLKYTKYSDDIINTLINIGGKKFIKELSIEYLLQFSSNRDKIINALINIGGKEFIMNLSSDDIYDLLKKSSNPQKNIESLINIGGKEFIMKLNNDGIHDLLLAFLKDHDAFINMLFNIGGEEFISNLNSSIINTLLNYSSEPEKIIDLLGNKGKEYINELKKRTNSYSGYQYFEDTYVVSVIGTSKAPMKLINSLGEEVGNKIIDMLPYLKEKDFFHIIKLSPVPKEIFNLLGTRGKKFFQQLDNNVKKILISDSKNPNEVKEILSQLSSPLNEIFKSLTSLQEELNEQRKLSIRETNLMKVQNFIKNRKNNQ